MRIGLIYFHKVREAMGRRDDEREVADGSTVAQVLEVLTAGCPALATLLPSLMTAVNEELSPRDRVLVEGDRLALMPPYSGG